MVIAELSISFLQVLPIHIIPNYLLDFLENLYSCDRKLGGGRQKKRETQRRSDSGPKFVKIARPKKNTQFSHPLKTNGRADGTKKASPN